MSLWKPSSSQTPDSVRDKIHAFTAGEDYLLDRELLPWDVRASMAHAKGLVKAGLLSAEEGDALLEGLTEILSLCQAGKFTVLPDQEDCHTAIEAKLSEMLGETGKKIHTGRSRNDQVLAAMRLFELHALAEIRNNAQKLGGQFLVLAARGENLPMPGYTHTQPAMLSSAGMWAAAFAELLYFDLIQLETVERLLDHSPLGTAAGYGVNLPLQRDFVAQEAGFGQLLINPIAAQNSRAKMEIALVNALESLAGTLGQFATDCVTYASNSFGFFALDDALCTGSSIMPQKKNPDSAELLRASAGELTGLGASLRAVSRNLGSGYHRDMQLTKKYAMQALRLTSQLLEVAHLIAEGLHFKADNMAAACGPELFAADHANELVRRGMSFREAYFEIKSKLDSLEVPDLQAALQAKSHRGGTGNLDVEALRERLG
ncbi:argininosuccinate lyase [Cyclonatronum proteinivorum]|uniref:argininosuccinate lyase n=1 Tax=Cyclonatronum proteinivorum TaxID=1457365 RepID=A0A345UJG7_9BACT|nr:argininosuccinate lyase [Cyclonatronum proteinivorum]AXJ00619.1 argininosuccinate lyase [Cyclonatronum proteinivorum]